MDEPKDSIKVAKNVLKENDEGNHTVPSRTMYPHQWLWDSCFIAIGLSNYDLERAQKEILSLLGGQWKNGMIPHMIFNKKDVHKHDKDLWRSWLNPNSPDDIATSGITQPPMLAEAIVQIGKKLSPPERKNWYKKVLPHVIDYHEWLYHDRCPHSEGLVVLVHPWEVGMDNTPPWIGELHEHYLPMWVRFLVKTRLVRFIELLRRDTRIVPIDERPSTEEIMGFNSITRRLRRKNYDMDKYLPHSLLAIEDLFFNSVLIRANHHVKEMAKLLNLKLSDELLENMKKTKAALEELWDPSTNQFYSRNFVTHDLLKEPSIATLITIYSGSIEKEKADKLVKSLENKHLYGSTCPAPSVPVNSPWFVDKNYWQGATWVNTNWLIIDGLYRMGYKDHADALKETTIEMVKQAGCYEYFSSLTGEPAGSSDFSWTAALYVDLVLGSKSKS